MAQNRAIKIHHAQKMSVAEMHMLRWMCGNTRRDKVRNEDIHTKIGVASIEEKIVDCLKITEDKSSENRVYTPDARLITASCVMPRRKA